MRGYLRQEMKPKVLAK